MSATKKFNLVIVSMFKNESWILKDWIKHYLKQGVDHFYLIDNGSTDNYQKIIKHYQNHITLIVDGNRNLKNPQNTLINQYFKDIVIKTSRWVLVCDCDEYVYCRNGYQTLPKLLSKFPSHIEIICLPWKIFGSNGHLKQPHSGHIIKSFTKRTRDLDETKLPNLGECKCIVRTTPNLQLDIHVSRHTQYELDSNQRQDLFQHINIYNANGELMKTQLGQHSQFNLHLNHYMFMSREYYEKIKCCRGGGATGFREKYTMPYYNQSEKSCNKIIDLELTKKR
jgi:glycosyltransferase involved in cell wall biosynthesis